MVSAGLRICIVILLFLGAPLATPAQADTGVTVHDFPSRAGSVSVESGTSSLVHAFTQANNSSGVRHENVEELNEDGDQAAVQQWLEQELSSQLESSVITLSENEYDQARSVLGDDYDSNLGKYVDVAGETNGFEGEDLATEFDTAQEKQQNLVSDVEEFNEKRQQYLEAKRAGNETQARELARELSQLADEIEQLNLDLSKSYTNLSTETDTNISVAQNRTESITQNISEQRIEIQQETFTNTTLTITDQTPEASFQTPLQIQGQLTAVNGTPLVNQRIVLSLGSQTVETRTNDAGNFTLNMRPTIAPQGQQQAVVQYVPQPAAVYLGSKTNTSITVEQVSPVITVSEQIDSVQFNDTVTVAGRVHDKGVNASNVPVRVAIGSTVLGTAITNSNGSFTVNTTLPANVPAGDQSLRVGIPVTDRAIGPGNTTVPIHIAETATNLTAERVTAVEADGQIYLQGKLRTTNGTALQNKLISIQVAGQTITTATTNTTGHYTAPINSSSIAAQTNNSSALVSIVFSGPGNLKQSHAQISISGFGPASQFGLWLAVACLAVCGLLGWILVQRDIIDLPLQDTDDTGTSMAATNDEQLHQEGNETEAQAISPGQSLRDHAATQLAEGETDSAVQAAYLAVRNHLVTSLGWETSRVESQTYWEFYDTCRENNMVTDDVCTRLKHLTEHYEYAQFTTSGPAEDRAAEAVDLATRIVGETQSN